MTQPVTEKVQFVSIWDDGAELKTDAWYDPETKIIDPIEVSGDEDEHGNCTREYIIRADGTEQDVAMFTHYVYKTV